MEMKFHQARLRVIRVAFINVPSCMQVGNRIPCSEVCFIEWTQCTDHVPCTVLNVDSGIKIWNAVHSWWWWCKIYLISCLMSGGISMYFHISRVWHAINKLWKKIKTNVYNNKTDNYMITTMNGAISLVPYPGRCINDGAGISRDDIIARNRNGCARTMKDMEWRSIWGELTRCEEKVAAFEARLGVCEKLWVYENSGEVWCVGSKRGYGQNMQGFAYRSVGLLVSWAFTRLKIRRGGNHVSVSHGVVESRAEDPLERRDDAI